MPTRNRRRGVSFSPLAAERPMLVRLGEDPVDRLAGVDEDLLGLLHLGLAAGARELHERDEQAAAEVAQLGLATGGGSGDRLPRRADLVLVLGDVLAAGL